RHLQRNTLMHTVEPRHAIELRTRDLQHRDLAMTGDRQHLLDPVVHLDPLCDVERRRRDLRAQRLEHAIATGDVLGLVAGLRLRAAIRPTRTITGGPGLALATRSDVAFRRGCALAGDMPAAILRFRRGTAPFKRLASVAPA